MTDKRSGKDDWQALAAEYSLGLAAGEDRSRAEQMLADADFTAEVARWRGRLAPLSNEVGAQSPPEGVWNRIAQRIDTPGERQPNVVVLRRRVTAWKAATAGMTALAASLALVLLVQPRASAPPVPTVQLQPASAPMVAMLGGDGKDMKVVATWNPDGRQLVLAVAGEMPADPDHAHELWVIPAGGTPRSLGTMQSARQTHMRLADALADLLQKGATIAISVEPPGGSPTGAPTGPVVASGALAPA